VGEFTAPQNQKQFTTLRRPAVVPFSIREAQEGAFNARVIARLERAIWERDPEPLDALVLPSAGADLFSNVYDLSKAQGGEFRKDITPIARPPADTSGGLNVNVSQNDRAGGSNGNGASREVPVRSEQRSGWRRR
jgi:hypothetical protein